MDDKITIIEGPPPTFELVEDGWSTGVLEGPELYNVAVTHLRTFNGSELIERCFRAWKRHENIHLEYKSFDGMKKEAAIVAARNTDADEGEVLVLWLRLADEEIGSAIDVDDDPDDSDDVKPQS